MKTNKTQAISCQNSSFMLRITNFQTPPQRVIFELQKTHFLFVFSRDSSDVKRVDVVNLLSRSISTHSV